MSLGTPTLAQTFCFKPADKATVLAAIRDEWGSEENFDNFVQDELPRILEASKQRYSRQLLMVAMRSLEHLLGD